MATTEALKEHLLFHENAILTSLMDVRYALDEPKPISEASVAAIRIHTRSFIELAERIQKQQRGVRR